MKIPDTVPWRSTGRTLGSGGQGEVQLVERRNGPTTEQFALKILRNTSSPQARARFAREIEAVKRVNDPRIIKIVDHSGPGHEFQFYVMPYYEGARTLASIIFSKPSPFHAQAVTSLALFKELVLAIRACEQSSPRIVHRDIKPENILVHGDDRLCVVDFGICFTESGELLTMADENVGTRNYAAPECESGNDDQLGPPADFYSAGKVLWSMITSERAFSRERPAFSVRSMQSIFPDRPMLWHLTSVFEKTIRSDWRDRSQTADELLGTIATVTELVEKGYWPIEQLFERCPSCGMARVEGFPQGHNVFGNPNPIGVVSRKCGHCGFCFARDERQLQAEITRREGLT